MSKNNRFLFILLILSLLLAAPSMVWAQEGDSDVEVDVLAEIVMPRLDEYGALIPELDHYNTIGIDAFVELLAENEDLIILDVREAAELENDGIIDGSIHIPMREIGYNLDLLPELDATIVVLCKGGFRATIAMTALHILGYENAMVLVGGFGGWAGADMPIDGAVLEVEPMMVSEDIDPLLVEYVAVYMENLPEGWGVARPNDFFEETFDTMPDLLLDVRSVGEWEDPGYIEGATHIWINEFAVNLDMLPEDLDANIVVYCASGYRGGIVMTYLGMMGYTNVRNLAGGINGWIAADLPLVN